MIRQRKNESRKEYLLRVAVAFVSQWPEHTVNYDETECDGYCFIEDVKNELGIDCDCFSLSLVDEHGKCVNCGKEF